MKKRSIAAKRGWLTRRANERRLEEFRNSPFGQALTKMLASSAPLINEAEAQIRKEAEDDMAFTVGTTLNIKMPERLRKHEIILPL